MTSSFITGIQHDSRAKTLTVSMRGGKAYTYKDVPRKTFKDFVKAESAGNFYNTAVRGKFEGI